MTYWCVRPGRIADRELLTKFCCAHPGSRYWQLEVEEFVRGQLVDWAFAPGAVEGDPRLLLVLDESSELVGITAHERVMLHGPNGSFAATRLQVVALALPWQGARFPSGERASDVVMSAAMTDIRTRVPPRYARVMAIVHEENARSIALCHRYGIVEEMDVDPLDEEAGQPARPRTAGAPANRNCG